MENTSTRVLTSPAPHNTFVDVRLLLVPLDKGPLPIRDLDLVDWAFAGTTSHQPTDGDKPPHDVFEHWIDSKHSNAGAVKDEGDFFPGVAPGESLERGEMVNPRTGKTERYEECWIDGLTKDVPGWKGWVLKWEGNDEAGSGRGLMARVGHLVQGVLRIGDEVAVGRWEIAASGDGKDEIKAIAEVGNAKSFFRGLSDTLKVGDSAKAENGQTWICVEAW